MMAARSANYALVILIGLVAVTSTTNSSACTGDHLPLHELPGFGWDILSSTSMGRVLAVNYSKCLKTSNEKLLLPDHMVELMHKTVYINTHVVRQPVYDIGDLKTFFPDEYIAGIYSEEYEREKWRRMTNGTRTVRTEVKVVRYRLVLQMKSPLDFGFKKRVLDAVRAAGRNDTETTVRLMELLVRDYGTHVVVSEDIGTKMIVEDCLSGVFADGKREIPIEVTAMHSFAEDHLWKWRERVDTDLYKRNTVWSRTLAVGGTPMDGTFKLTQWLEGALENLTVVDRKTIPLMDFMYSHKFPGVRPHLLTEIRYQLQNAIRSYYKKNIHEGCSDPLRPNFDFKSNVDNLGHCDGPDNIYSFGGVYETCEITSGNADLCAGKSKINQLIAGTSSCPSGHTSHLLGSLPLESHHRIDEPYKHCSGWGVFKKCRTNYRNVVSTTTAIHSIYWCSAQGMEVPFSLFGGIYSTNLVNPVTGSKSCAQNHEVLASIDDNRINICGSLNISHGYQNSVLFGGFIPFGKPVECPKNYKSYDAGTVPPNSDVVYCMQGVPLNYYSVTPLIRPPFSDNGNGSGSFEDYDEDYYNEMVAEAESSADDEVLLNETTTVDIQSTDESPNGTFIEDTTVTNFLYSMPAKQPDSTQSNIDDYLTSTSTELGNASADGNEEEIRNDDGNIFGEFQDVAGHSAPVKSEKESENDTALIIYIVVGCVVALAIVVIVLVVYFKTKQQHDIWFNKKAKADSVQMDLVDDEESVETL